MDIIKMVVKMAKGYVFLSLAGFVAQALALGVMALLPAIVVSNVGVQHPYPLIAAIWLILAGYVACKYTFSTQGKIVWSAFKLLKSWEVK